MANIKNLAIIQARTGASRLPNKVLFELCGATVLERVIERVKRCSAIDDVIVATTILKCDLPIVELCSKKSVSVFCGAEEDVLDRYYQIAKLLKPENIIRITADCPLLDPSIVSQVISKHIESNSDYSSNTLNITYPDGLDCEIMKFDILKKSWEKAIMASEREHVTQYIIQNTDIVKYSVECDVNYSSERWTLDTMEDYYFIQKVYNELYNSNPEFGFYDVLGLLKKNPELRNINCKSHRNEGLEKSLANDYKIITDYRK